MALYVRHVYDRALEERGWLFVCSMDGIFCSLLCTRLESKAKEREAVNHPTGGTGDDMVKREKKGMW